MLEIYIGIISGIISGMGMGGGAVLILILSIFLSVEQHIAQSTNLIFFIPTSIASICISTKEKIIDWRIGMEIIITGILGAIIGANISLRLNVVILKKAYGVFLAIITIYEIFFLIKENKTKVKNK